MSGRRFSNDDPTAQARPSDAGRLSLAVLADGLAATHALPERGTVTIGRGTDADIRIDHEAVSRKHLRLAIDDVLSIVDLGSSNGTKLREQELAANTPVIVAPGDVIELGTVMLVIQRHSVEVPGSAAKQPTALPSPSFVLASPMMQTIHRMIERVATGMINVLVLGETGVGKEIIAERLHELSPRASGPLLKLNCAALSETLLESELFGHERGAFTGAVSAKPGLLETARGGTVFLDEIGDLPLPLQAKLLRVIEDKRVMRVGGLENRPIDVRFVAATHRDLEAAVNVQTFRQDLYYRLNGFTLVIPPLRERVEEIVPLARSFASSTARSQQLATPRFEESALAMLRAHAWPGNVRELRNVIERAVLLAGSDPIGPEHLSLDKQQAASDGASLREGVMERERALIVDALERAGGNQTEAARLLGISRRTLVSRLTEYGLPRPRKDKSRSD